MDETTKYDELVEKVGTLSNMLCELVTLAEEAYKDYLDVGLGIAPPSEDHLARNVAVVIVQDDEMALVTLRDLLGTVMYISDQLNR